jgi:5-methyltetrahydrofolate--homocysteine methyltransferase
MPDLSSLSKAVISGDRDKAVQLAMEAVSAGVNPEDIITKGLQLGMMTVGEKFSSGEYFLPDMLMAARAMKSALEVLQPLLAKSGLPTLGRVVIGTVQGDMHDIGKNVVATFLGGSGFEVYDLGLNVSARQFVDAVREKKADILGLSALLTTTMPTMGQTIKDLEKAGLRSRVKVIVGGAPVTAEFARFIGADAHARDGGEAIPVCKKLVQRGGA